MSVCMFVQLPFQLFLLVGVNMSALLFSQSVLVLAAALVCGPCIASAGKLDDTYILGPQGQSCAAACGAIGRSCLDNYDTGDTTARFEAVGVKCSASPAEGGDWWAPDQPSVVTDKTDRNYGECLGYKKVPPHVSCQATFYSTSRLCHCGADDTAALTFGTGLAGGHLTVNETTIFSHKITSGSTGVMSHFWSTCSPECEAGAIVRYYFDGETTPSIEFSPPMAAGVGFDDPKAPWGTKWFGMGAGNGGGQAWFNNFKMPFQSSVRVTVQHKTANFGGFYIIVRGALVDSNIRIGEVELPKNARLWLQKYEGPLAPLEYLTVANASKGTKGLHFMSALSVGNDGTGGLNFLEGCYHLYSPPEQAFPGTLLATGTEDYFDSGWYFNAGEFHLPVSGFTHINQNKTNTEWSAYRFHEMDPIRFNDGFKLEWRCGDALDPATNLKCFTQKGGNTVGHPTCGHVVSYAWVYTWD
eukprot:m.245747 g.245747  ORF g.245747 m.245747 type:complete len:470 (+) comp19054_c0_seq3:1593-3002(+)